MERWEDFHIFAVAVTHVDTLSAGCNQMTMFVLSFRDSLAVISAQWTHFLKDKRLDKKNKKNWLAWDKKVCDKWRRMTWTCAKSSFLHCLGYFESGNFFTLLKKILSMIASSCALLRLLMCRMCVSYVEFFSLIFSWVLNTNYE